MVKIKICGITNLEDYNHAVTHGVDYTGFIFYTGSPRCIGREAVKKIIDSGKKGTHLKVGVFVNEEQQRVKEIFYRSCLDLVQLHGEESPEYCHELDLPYWKVIRVKDHFSLLHLDELPGETVVLDTYSNKTRGGTGQPFDLELAREVIARGKKIIIAGGVSIDNIDSILSLSPYAVDLSSSLESSPGKKSVDKINQFFNKIKSRG